MARLLDRIAKLENARPVTAMYGRIVVGTYESEAEAIARTYAGNPPANLIVRRLVAPEARP